MKKFVLLAAIACGISFTGNATTLKTGVAKTIKKSAVSTKLASPLRIQFLYEMEFTCEGQGWTIPVVGYTQEEMLNTYFFYLDHLDC